ncbi:hypothetical protein ABZ341_40455 [Streptomyces sp. NPDC006173]|uniref:hypothetical protein n=1 Tax=Streptomyces sp. NPDC006173 TaxID=3155349 RepID=UPI0033CC9424
MSDNDRQHRQRAAVELLKVWTGDIYDEDLEESDDLPGGYVPLEWTMDTAGHLHGELPPAEGVSCGERVEWLRVWADYLGIDLFPAAGGGVQGSRPYTPAGACGITVRVSVATPGGSQG